MVRIFSSPRKSQPEDTTRNDRTEELPVAENRPGAVRNQVDDRTGSRTAAATEADDQREADQREADQREADQREAAAHRADPGRTAVRERERDRTVDLRPTEPRARASGMATIGLILGVAAALLVLTGTLAGYGIAVGVVGLFFSIGGISATGRRHVAGKSDALLGLLLSLGAMVIGGLALAGALPWLSPDTDKVGQVRDWLDANITNRF